MTIVREITNTEKKAIWSVSDTAIARYRSYKADDRNGKWFLVVDEIDTMTSIGTEFFTHITSESSYKIHSDFGSVCNGMCCSVSETETKAIDEAEKYIARSGFLMNQSNSK